MGSVTFQAVRLIIGLAFAAISLRYLRRLAENHCCDDEIAIRHGGRAQ